MVQDLLTGIEEFSIRFYRPDQQAQVNQGVNAGWRNRWEMSGSMPRAVEVTLDTQDYGLMQRRFLTASVATQQPDSSDLQRAAADDDG